MPNEPLDPNEEELPVDPNEDNPSEEDGEEEGADNFGPPLHPDPIKP